jgi:hypothetical protein
MKIKKIALSIMLSMSFTTGMLALDNNAKLLNENVPSEYIVKKGDTLWDISGKFLKSPYHWEKLLEKNNQIENPDLIYPDDIIYLSKNKNGETVLKVKRKSVRKTLIMTPSKKYEEFRKPIPTIDFEKLSNFVKDIKIIKRDDFMKKPYIIASEDDNLLIQKGTNIFSRGDEIDPSYVGLYGIYKLKGIVKNKKSEYIGHEVERVGIAKLISMGDKLKKLKVLEVDGEITKKDRIMKYTDNKNIKISLSYPEKEIEANILLIEGAIANASIYDTIVIDKGLDENLVIGNLLELNKKGLKATDPETGEILQLTNKPYGEIMLLRVDETTSVGIILSATDRVSSKDLLLTPQ